MTRIFNNLYPMPEGLTTIGGYLCLNGYKYPLPESVQIVTGSVDLVNYEHHLPEGLTVEGEVYVWNYDLTKHKLPGQLAIKVFQQWAEETAGQGK